MAKFVAGQAVERLEWDFTDYGGGEGFIDEPTTGRVNAFFRSMKNTMREVKSLQRTASIGDLSVEEMSDEKLAETLGQVDEASEGVDRLQRQTIESLAELCGAQRVEDAAAPDGYRFEGGSPSLQDLEKLPYRVLQTFTTWLMGEIRPKGNQGPASKR